MAEIKYSVLAASLLGENAFFNQDIGGVIKPGALRFIQTLCALAWNRLRLSAITELKSLKNKAALIEDQWQSISLSHFTVINLPTYIYIYIYI